SKVSLSFCLADASSITPLDSITLCIISVVSALSNRSRLLSSSVFSTVSTDFLNASFEDPSSFGSPQPLHVIIVQKSAARTTRRTMETTFLVNRAGLGPDRYFHITLLSVSKVVGAKYLRVTPQWTSIRVC